MSYLKDWRFWLAVIVVAGVTHFVMNKVGKGGSTS